MSVAAVTARAVAGSYTIIDVDVRWADRGEIASSSVSRITRSTRSMRVDGSPRRCRWPDEEGGMVERLFGERMMHADCTGFLIAKKHLGPEAGRTLATAP